MSIYADYTHSIVHHQTERELIAAAEQRRLSREAGGSLAVPWWHRLLHAEQRRANRSTARRVRGGTVRTAH